MKILSLLALLGINWQIRFYQLALLRCNTSENWHLHGLWPDYDDQHYPSYCGKSKFNETVFDELKNEMDKNWYSCQGTNMQLWKHEYQKHGSCTGMNETQYFNKTLQLLTKARRQDWMEWYCSMNGLECQIKLGLDFNILRHVDVI